jgi:phospholipase/carboxylesterase
MLHGRGADEEDLLGLADALDDRFLVISLRAPYPFPFGGYTWFDISEDGSPDPEMFRSSYDRLLNSIRNLVRNHRSNPDRLFLLGFSMGTMMSFALALTNPDMFRGVIANSGYVPNIPDLVYHWSGLSNTRFFITHGLYDPVIPVTFGRATRDLFQQSNAEWTYREYTMGHEISRESFDDIAAWLTTCLD